MSRPRIAIAGFQHETNTFSPLPTPYEEFEQGGAWPALQTGDGVIKELSGLNVPIGGFIDDDSLGAHWIEAQSRALFWGIIQIFFHGHATGGDKCQTPRLGHVELGCSVALGRQAYHQGAN